MLKTIKINKIPKLYPKHLKENLLHREFSFTSGLNILYGQNGAGKSTLLECIKDAYNIPRLKICSTPIYVSESKFTYKIKKDNEVAINCDAFFHHNKMDEYFDYGVEQVLLTYDKGSQSQGENKMEAQLVLSKFIERGSWQNESFDRALPLLIMDEPTLSMSFKTERAFFNYMAQWAHGGYQIILATNSIACFNTKWPNDVNYIEVEEGSIKEVKDNLKDYVKEL